MPWVGPDQTGEQDPSQPAISLEETTPPSSAPHVRRWGQLIVLERIGSGAFADVYRARDPELERNVALKLYHPDRLEQLTRAGLLREARHLARVHHPNIVTIHGADEHDGRVGIWMELVEGDTLRDFLEGRTLSAEEAAQVGLKLCQALAAVHSSGLIHGDVKAQNVMRESDGRIVLMDFSATRAREPHEPDAAAGVTGTPLYMAPELFEGGAPSVQSDLYALGVLLFHLVSNDYPVDASSMTELVFSHVSGQRRLLRDTRPDLPDEFVRAVERALAQDPQERPTSAGELERALVEALIESERPDTRGAAWWLGLAAGGLAGVGVLGFITSMAFRVFLQIPAAFSTDTPAEYFGWGVRALVPVAFYWIVLILIAAIGVGIGRGVVRLAGRRSGARITSPRRSWLDRLDPIMLATTIFIAGAAAWLLVTLSFSDLFRALGSLREVPATGADLSILGPDWHPYHRTYVQLYALLGFCLAFAVLQILPQLEKRSRGEPTVRLMKWGAATVAALAIVSAVLPYRLLWHSRFEPVTFAGRHAYVLGETANELLLYVPATERPHLIVASQDPRVERLPERFVEPIFGR